MMQSLRLVSRRFIGPWLGGLMLLFLALQCVFALRIATMAWVAPSSTTFERSEQWRLAQSPNPLRWRQEWVDLHRISAHLQRAVIVSEGAHASARHYFSKSAADLTEWEAARLAVMLPRPKWFQKNPESGYWADRSEVILARMAGVKTP